MRVSVGGKPFRWKVRKLNTEDLACTSLVLFYVWQAGNLFVQKCLGGSRILVLGMYLFLAAGIGISILAAARRQVAYWLLSELLVITAYTISCLYGYADMSTLLHNLFWTLGICVPIAMNLLCISDLERYDRLLYQIAKPMVLVLSFTIILEFLILRTNVGEYDMPAAYALIFYCIVLCNAVLDRVNILDVCVLLAGLGVVLLWGSRGTYLCFLVFVVLKVCFGISSPKKKHFLMFCGILLAAAGILFIFLVQMYYSGSVSGGMLRFRSLAKLFSGEMFRSDSRVSLYSYYGDLILQKPLLGWGVTGNWLNSQNYPHNLFVELLLAFGVLPGIGIVLLLVFLICYIMKFGSKAERTLFLIYSSNAFSLMVSGTFLQSLSFFVCMFIGIRCMKRRRMAVRKSRFVRKEECDVLQYSGKKIH